MAGEAKTSQFLLSTATLMLGTPANLRKLNPADSVGLAKNVVISGTPSFADLTQGVTGKVVASTMIKNDIKVTAEIFELTTKNLAYGLSLDGASFTPMTTATTLTAAITGDGTSTNVLAVTSATGLAAGDRLIIQGANDQIAVRKILSISSNNVTVTEALATGQNFAIGDSVKKTNLLPVGTKLSIPYFSAKIVASLADGVTPIVVEFPKVRITKGFSLAFQEGSNYGNLPFEFEAIDMVSTDPFYSDTAFANLGLAALYTP